MKNKFWAILTVSVGLFVFDIDLDTQVASAQGNIGAPAPGQPMIWLGPSLGGQFHAPIGGIGPNAPNMSGLSGSLFQLTAPVSTGTGTSEQVLGTYSLPASSLDIVGRKIHIFASFLAANNANTKSAKLYFGASAITVAAVTVSAATVVVLECEVLKTGASTQNVTCYGQNGSAIVPNVFVAGTDTDTAAIVIKATATDATSSAADMILEDFQILYYN